MAMKMNASNIALERPRDLLYMEGPWSEWNELSVKSIRCSGWEIEHQRLLPTTLSLNARLLNHKLKSCSSQQICKHDYLNHLLKNYIFFHISHLNQIIKALHNAPPFVLHCVHLSLLLSLILHLCSSYSHLTPQHHPTFRSTAEAHTASFDLDSPGPPPEECQELTCLHHPFVSLQWSLLSLPQLWHPTAVYTYDHRHRQQLFLVSLHQKICLQELFCLLN